MNKLNETKGHVIVVLYL